jgi:hypothetical protein
LGGLEARTNNSSGTASKPFIVSAVVLAFLGSFMGSIWMMSILGEQSTATKLPFSLHPVLQIDGFLMVLIMGIGYMIIPRFRNSRLPAIKLAHASLALLLLSIAFTVASEVWGVTLNAAAGFARIAGIAIFTGIAFWTLRIRPKLLGLADYFIGLSVATLLALGMIRLAVLTPANTLSEVQMLLLFPLLMIFGVEYKTMPSFLGFIRPRKTAGEISFVFAAVAVVLGISSMLYDQVLLPLMFNLTLLFSVATFGYSLFIFGGFDNSEILSLISGEKKARYLYTTAYSRLSFLFLYAGIIFAVLFGASSTHSYMLYDLSIHLIAIGFIGTTITLYLPLMLPPIIGRQIQFARFNHAPVLLILAALVLRAVADAALTYEFQLPYPLAYLMMTSGWLVISALITFVIMVHRSTKHSATTSPASIGISRI